VFETIKTKLNEIKAYLTLHLKSVIIIALAAILLFSWIMPSEKSKQERIAEKYNTLALQYDKDGKAVNTEIAIQLQKEINDIESTGKVTSFIKWVLHAIIMTILSAMMGTLLQYLFTDLKFTRAKFTGSDGNLDESDRIAAMPVLAVALFCGTLIVCTCYCLIFVV